MVLLMQAAAAAATSAAALHPAAVFKGPDLSSNVCTVMGVMGVMGPFLPMDMEFSMSTSLTMSQCKVTIFYRESGDYVMQ